MSKNDINLQQAFYMEPEEVVKYFESKGLKTSFDWHEVYEDAHAKAFTIAKMTQADLLKDTHDMLTTAIKEGWSEGKFQKNAAELFEKKGWTGKKEVTNPKTGEKQIVELGTPRRIKNIFNCNMQSAYAVGRYKQQLEDVDIAPYFQYVCLLDGKERPEHRALNGKVYRYNDPIWNYLYPPNGWKCRCYVIQLSKHDIKKRGLTVESSEGHLKEITEIVGGEEKTITVYTFSKGGNIYQFKPDAGWGTNLGKTYNNVLDSQLETKVNKINLKSLQTQIKSDITTHNVYQNIAKIKNINILTSNYNRYFKIIEIRNQNVNNLYTKYKKDKTKESLDKALTAYKKLIKAEQKQDILLGKYIDDVINSINNKPKSTLLLGKVGKNLKTESLILKSDLEKLVSNIPSIKLNLKEIKKDRSYQNQGTIYFSNYYKNKKLTNKGRLTALHEAMHWLEETDKNIGQKSIDFLEKRTINDKEEKLSVLTGIASYKHYEIAKKDNFFNPYCGKIYKYKEEYYGTEILSMGIQELLSNPIEFYKKDKEYFKFVISILKGDI